VSKKTRPGEGARRGGYSEREIENRVRKYYQEGKPLLEQQPRAGAKQLKSKSIVVESLSPASKHVRESERRRFARVYASEELEELLTLRAKRDGTPLGWGIVRKLMTVRDKAMRRKLEIRAAKESLSVRQVDALLREKVLGAKRSKGSRPFAAPKHLAELVQRLEMHTEESRRRLSHWARSPLLNQMPSTMKVDESLRARALAIRGELKILARTARDLARKLESIAADGSGLRNKAPLNRSKRRP
jgi:hypothetical protein